MGLHQYEAILSFISVAFTCFETNLQPETQRNAVRNFTGLSVGMGIIKCWLSVHFWVNVSFNEKETVNVWSLRSHWVCQCTNIRQGRKTKTAVLSCPCHLAFKWHSSQPITPPHWQHNTKPTAARVLFFFFCSRLSLVWWQRWGCDR